MGLLLSRMATNTSKHEGEGDDVVGKRGAVDRMWDELSIAICKFKSDFRAREKERRPKIGMRVDSEGVWWCGAGSDGCSLHMGRIRRLQWFTTVYLRTSNSPVSRHYYYVEDDGALTAKHVQHAMSVIAAEYGVDAKSAPEWANNIIQIDSCDKE